MKKETSERYQKARQMYELGMSKDEIADAIGIKPNSVSKILYIVLSGELNDAPIVTLF